MAHPILNDPTLPDCLRRAFERVTCQIVRVFDDGSEGIINMMDRAKAETELVEHRKRIGRRFDSGVLVDVVIRAVP